MIPALRNGSPLNSHSGKHVSDDEVDADVDVEDEDLIYPYELMPLPTQVSAIWTIFMVVIYSCKK